MSTENDDGVPTVRLDVTQRQLALLTEIVHDWLEAEREDGNDHAYFGELTDLDELLRGSHPRWNGQTQAFFEVRPLPDEDHAHLLRTLFAPEPEEGER